MHIVFLTPEYPRPLAPDGGLANYLRQIALGVSSAGHRATVLLPGESHARWADGAVSVIEAPAPMAGVPGLHRFPLMSAVAQRAAAVTMARAVWRIHRTTPITVVQASSFGAPALSLLRQRAFPVVCRLSSLGPLWRRAYGRPTGPTDRMLDAMERRQIRKASLCFAPSRWLATQAEREMGVPVEVIRTPCSLDPADARPSRHAGQLRGLRYLLFFGTLSRIKGADVLAEILPPLLTSFPDLHFVACGRDDGLGQGQSAASVIMRACAGKEDRLHLFPARSKEELIPIIQNAHGVLMPSRVDNYPNACLEAQALGVPVIGTDGSSLEEMIEPGTTGFLGRPGHAPSYAGAVRQLLALDPQAYAAMRKEILHVAARRCTENPVERHLDLYRRAVDAWTAAASEEIRRGRS